eukprot:TRINITY_DN14344_c0_g1_i1.p1 TRINITY_DN14344_c0_g1~~TRINITY_DN14344_c0_g1_i1.p1  ORF type:complete len:470 (+),score=188.91 TRINITY_DN14344_c0_g1_i1:33-1412(+)
MVIGPKEHRICMSIFVKYFPDGEDITNDDIDVFRSKIENDELDSDDKEYIDVLERFCDAEYKFDDDDEGELEEECDYSEEEEMDSEEEYYEDLHASNLKEKISSNRFGGFNLDNIRGFEVEELKIENRQHVTVEEITSNQQSINNECLDTTMDDFFDDPECLEFAKKLKANEKKENRFEVNKSIDSRVQKEKDEVSKKQEVVENQGLIRSSNDLDEKDYEAMNEFSEFLDSEQIFRGGDPSLETSYDPTVLQNEMEQMSDNDTEEEAVEEVFDSDISGFQASSFMTDFKSQKHSSLNPFSNRGTNSEKQEVIETKGLSQSSDIFDEKDYAAMDEFSEFLNMEEVYCVGDPSQETAYDPTVLENEIEIEEMMSDNNVQKEEEEEKAEKKAEEMMFDDVEIDDFQKSSHMSNFNNIRREKKVSKDVDITSDKEVTEKKEQSMNEPRKEIENSNEDNLWWNG